MRVCKLLALVALMALSANAFATKNLPLTCAKPLTTEKQPCYERDMGCSVPQAASVCAVADYACVPGGNGKYTATPAGVWVLWENIAPTDDIRAWATDLTPGTCAGGRMTIKKQDATTAATEVIPVALNIRWQLPTTLTTGDPIVPVNPITKVTLVYGLDYPIPDASDEVLKAQGFTVVTLAGTASEYKNTIQSRVGGVVHARVRVSLKNGETSPFSAEATWTVPEPIRDPSEVTNVTINNSPPADM